VSLTALKIHDNNIYIYIGLLLIHKQAAFNITRNAN